MDDTLLLVKCVTLLYRESLLPDTNENSSSLVRTALDSLKLKQDQGLTLSRANDVLIALKNMCIDMCENPVNHEYEKSELLQTIKTLCGENESLYQAFEQGIDAEMSEASLKRTIINIKKTLHTHFRDDKLKELIGKAYIEFTHKRDKIKDVTKWLTEFIACVEPFQIGVNSKDPAVIEDVAMHDIDKVRNVFESIKTEESGESILRTGWQGLNRMLDGGFRETEEWSIGALQHNYKSGFSLTIFRQIAQYNTPKLRDVNKKPLLLRISFEDSIKINFKFLYKSLKENELGKVISTAGVPHSEMADYVQKKLSENGFHIRLLEVNPSLWTYKDICNKIIELEAEGYEIKLCMVDYLLKLPTTGCDQGPFGHDIRNMYERIRAFMSSRRIPFITPHQLSTEAKKMVREGRSDFVKLLPGMGFYAGCGQLDQVVDGELFIHIEKLNKESYLTVQRGKHRKVEITPDEHLYMALKFVKNGIIPDDVDKDDTTRQKVGGPTLSEGGGASFHQYDDSF